MDLDAAFGWPKGTVRAILAFTIVGGAVLASFIRPEAATELKVLAGAVVGFYFGSKAKGGTE